MTEGRLHLLDRAALCYEQAGLPLKAARCRERAGEPAAAARLYRAAGDLTQAARCYERAGDTAQAAQCLLSLGRPEEAANLWLAARNPLEAAWILIVDARRPRRARDLLAEVNPTRLGVVLRRRIALALCAAAEGSVQPLVDALVETERRLADVSPTSERARVERWAVQAADEVGRPDLAAQVFAASYRCGQRGVVERWRAWAVSALGGTAGIPDAEEGR